jgi:hypothetical protein
MSQNPSVAPPEENPMPQLEPAGPSADRQSVWAKLKRLFRSRLGKTALFLVSIKPTIRVIYEAVDFYGNMQTAGQVYADHIKPVIEFLNTGWGTVVLMAVGFGLLIFQLWRQNKRAPQGEEERNPLNANQGESDVDELKGRIKDLEAGNASLRRAGEVADRTIQQLKKESGRAREAAETLSLRLSVREGLLEQYKWLHEMAEAQARDIGSYVAVERVRFCYHKFAAPIPYIVFAVDLRNSSVFDIAIEGEVKGHITLAGERLLGEKELVYNPKIPPSGKDSLTLKQRLNPTEVNLVAACEKEPLGAFYYFEKLEIMIAARTEPPRFGRAPLELPQHISSKDDEVAQLKEELASLHRRSEAIVRLNLALGGAYTLANLFEAGEPPSRERIEHWYESTLRGHIHPEELEALQEGLPELTDSPDEQRALIDKYCARLRGLIRSKRSA